MKRLTAAEITAAVGGILAAGDGEHPITGISIDSRTVKEGDLFIPIIGERMDGHRFIPEALKGGCGAVLIMEDHPLPEETGSSAVIRCKDTTKALQDLARWYLNALSIRRIGVTGSTGKTTTKEMIYHICSEKYKTQRNLGNFNNHIGLPLTILSFEEGTEVGVLEMGMSSPGEIDLLAELVRPEIGVITNIGTAHIENLGSREEILKAKLEITHYFSEDNLLIINRDNDLLKQIQDPPYRLVNIGENGKSHLILSAITDLGEKGIGFTLERKTGDSYQSQEFRLHIPGRHNAYNAALAVGAGLELGITMEEAAAGLEKLRDTDKRLSIRGKNGIKIIDDTYNASVDSMKSAIDLLAGMAGVRRVAVLGDMLEMGPQSPDYHREIGEYLRGKGVDLLITVGRDSLRIAEGAAGDPNPPEMVHYENTDQLIGNLKTRIVPGDIALFKGSRGIGLDEAVRRLLED